MTGRRQAAGGGRREAHRDGTQLARVAPDQVHGLVTSVAVARGVDHRHEGAVHLRDARLVPLLPRYGKHLHDIAHGHAPEQRVCTLRDPMSMCTLGLLY